MAETDHPPVIDLREDVPMRRRQMRGLPHETDRALRAYRNLPAAPLPARTPALAIDLPPESTLEPAPVLGATPPQGPEPVRTDHGSGADGRRPFVKGDPIVLPPRLRSVATVSLAFFLGMFAIATVDRLSTFRASALAGLLLVATATLLTVVIAVIYTQISRPVGRFKTPRRSHRRTARHGVRR